MIWKGKRGERVKGLTILQTFCLILILEYTDIKQALSADT